MKQGDFSVLVHQLLALTLQFGAISAERCWEQLSRVPDFAGIQRPDFDAIILMRVGTTPPEALDSLIPGNGSPTH